jgi:hypothetical protein
MVLASLPFSFVIQPDLQRRRRLIGGAREVHDDVRLLTEEPLMWTGKIGLCFADSIFGKEKSERDHARKLLKEAHDSGDTKEYVQKEFLWYLWQQNLHSDSMKDRMQRAMDGIEKMWKDDD